MSTISKVQQYFPNIIKYCANIGKAGPTWAKLLNSTLILAQYFVLKKTMGCVHVYTACNLVWLNERIVSQLWMRQSASAVQQLAWGLQRASTGIDTRPHAFTMLTQIETRKGED